MADHALCDRDPDDILNDFDHGCAGQADHDMREIMWQIIDSVRDSYALALRGLGRDGAKLDGQLRPAIDGGTGVALGRRQIETIEQTVEDYLTNNWGDNA